MKFIYNAKSSKGEIQNGNLEAPNETAAAKMLQEQGLFVLNLAKEGENKLTQKGNIKIPFLSDRVSLKDKIIFTQQLAMMVKSGLPLIDAFGALKEQTENKYFAGVIADLAENVRGGKTFSGSLLKYPKIFSNFYIAMISSGEKSGKLDEVLGRLAEELEKDYELISKVKAAITYPILIVFALIGIIILMLIFVVPQLKKIFSDIGVELPLITRIILGSSDTMIKYWYLFLIGLIGLAVGLRFYGKTTKGGLVLDSLKIKVPVIGKLFRKIYMARFCRTAGSLVVSGLPILDIIKTTSKVLGNRVYQVALEKTGEDVKNGLTFSSALKKQKIFPAMIYHLVSIGEKSGKLDEILLTMAVFFDREVEATTNSLASLIEPILIIIVGAGVGLVVASVIMPIYSLVNVI
ncbi:MAG: type II secretion system F family protein [Patescibacteria group bacterium]|nr:type II secretion system F family protein [Patescibacteria group bacterium]